MWKKKQQENIQQPSEVVAPVQVQQPNVEPKQDVKVEKLLYEVTEVPTQTTRVIYNTKTGEALDYGDALTRILNILEAD